MRTVMSDPPQSLTIIKVMVGLKLVSLCKYSMTEYDLVWNNHRRINNK